MASRAAQLREAIDASPFLARVCSWAGWLNSLFLLSLDAARREAADAGITLRAALDHAAGGALRPWTLATHLRAHHSLQRSFAALLLPLAGNPLTSLSRCLDRRLRRWHIPLLPARRAALLLRRLPLLRPRIPPRCLAAVLRTVLNGWTTLRRFQSSSPFAADCLAGCAAPDSIEHYSTCPRLFPHAVRLLGLVRSPSPEARLQDFLLLGAASDPDTLQAWAFWVAALYDWHNWCRHGGRLCAPELRVAAVPVHVRMARTVSRWEDTTRR